MPRSGISGGQQCWSVAIGLCMSTLEKCPLRSSIIFNQIGCFIVIWLCVISLYILDISFLSDM